MTLSQMQKVFLTEKDLFKDIIGQGQVKEELKSAILMGRNIIILGPSGIGKTTLAKNVAKLLPDIEVNDCLYHCLPKQAFCPSCLSSKNPKTKIIKGSERFIRIQGSPDLTVEDLFGDIEPLKALEFGPLSLQAFTPGKIFKANNGVLFFDELNRCPEKLQNALLQVLQEHIVTIGTYDIDFPAQFIFIATMNPYDTSTERLSDVLLDRMDMIYMGYPETLELEEQIVLEKAHKLIITFPSNLLRYIVTFIRELRENKNLEKVPSVRASIGIYERSQSTALLHNRKEVTLEDVRQVINSVVAHRIKLKPSIRSLQTPQEFLEKALHEYTEHGLGKQALEQQSFGKDNSTDTKQQKTVVNKFEEIEEYMGKLHFQHLEDKLMHSVLENQESIIEDAKIIKNSINHSLFSFTPDILFEQLVKNYSTAKQLYGEKLLRQLTGYDNKYIEKNIRIPEFQRELKKKLYEKIKGLQDLGLLTKQGEITEKGIELAALVLYLEEIDLLGAQGLLGEKPSEQMSHYGSPFDIRAYHKGDRYKDIALRRSVKTAVRRKHTKLIPEDIKIFTRHAKGKISIIYGLDASGSMKGYKIETCKKAGVALAFKALQEKDEVGIIVFGQEVQTAVAPCSDFGLLLMEITKIRPSKETDIAACILHSIDLFPRHDALKHLLLLTDAMPTVGAEPFKATFNAVEKAIATGVTVSLIGIQLDAEAKKFAEKLTELGKGRLYIVEDLEELDKIVLFDYYNCL